MAEKRRVRDRWIYKKWRERPPGGDARLGVRAPGQLVIWKAHVSEGIASTMNDCYY